MDFYNSNAENLFHKYQQVDPEKVHGSWLNHLPVKSGLALDVGGGSGRDAVWLAQKGWNVIVVEPALALRELGEKFSAGYSTIWLDDRLPDLIQLQTYRQQFVLILVSGVFMHLPYQQRVDSLDTLVELLVKNGLLIITLRKGPDTDRRELYNVDAEEIKVLAEKKFLKVEVTDILEDELKRANVTWQTVIIHNRVNE
ncbi:MAG: methyltransferase domain-containing protein [Proteobacteria bacterium]|nr:methyltransferase domain-containing protein [Pseudomonadota bacterium]